MMQQTRILASAVGIAPVPIDCGVLPAADTELDENLSNIPNEGPT
jgi:hypothetical protein